MKHTTMLSRILLLLGFVFTSSVMFSQGTAKSKSPIHYRLLMTSVTVEDVSEDEISISLNAFNTGRKPIDFSQFNAVPKEMEIKFEESFYRSNLSELEQEITSNLLNKNISIPNGKILRNLRFNLPCSETLYKQLTKKDKRFSKNYTPKKRNNSPSLKYKTSDEKDNPLPSFLAKKKKKKKKTFGNKTEPQQEVAIVEKEVKKIKVETPKNTIDKPEKEMVETPEVAIVKKELNKEIVTAPKPDKTIMADKTMDKNMTDKKIVDQKMADKKVEDQKMKDQKMVDQKVADQKMKDQKMADQKMKDQKMKDQKMKDQKMKDQKMADQKMEPTKKKNVGVVIKEKKEQRLSILDKKKKKKKEIEEIKKDTYKIEKASQKEDEKAILESLGVGSPKVEQTKSKGKKKKDNGVAFDTKEGVEASKNSYAEKAVCPDLILNNVSVVKKSKKWITLEYTLTNVGKGPARLGKSGNGQGIALRAFLSSSERISRGALPLGGGFVSYDNDGSQELYPNNSYTGTLKLDIRKMTRFTPFVILNLDPFNVLDECDKTNNYGQVKIGG